MDIVAAFANGDARVALNTLEMVVLNGEVDRQGDITVTRAVVEQCLGKKALLYDKRAEEHYNIISAIHKSLRNSDPDAALYWTARMLEAGEDPLYIARRLIRFAKRGHRHGGQPGAGNHGGGLSGLHFLGMPECNVHLAHAVTYLALAPKSRAVDSAYAAAARDARESLAEPVPMQIRNAPTGLMKELGYGQGYQFDPTAAYNVTAMQCLPDSLAGRRYYHPGPFGEEAGFGERLEGIRRAGRKRAGSDTGGGRKSARQHGRALFRSRIILLRSSCRACAAPCRRSRAHARHACGGRR